MSDLPAEVQPGIEVSDPAGFDAWLRDHADSESEIWTILFKKASGKQTVTSNQLLEEAVRYGWVDVKTKTVDEQRYGIRFVPRRPGGNWTAANRELARRLVDEGRMQAGGIASLPADF